jgi:hypothetical protein
MKNKDVLHYIFYHFNKLLDQNTTGILCCETATFIPYSAKQQHSETLSATSTGHYTICCKNLSLALLKMGKICPKDIELILKINKTVIAASSWCSVLLYLQ